MGLNFQSAVKYPPLLSKWTAFRVNVRHFSAQMSTVPDFEAKVHTARSMKTVVDKQGRILRKVGSSTWESVVGLEVHAQINARSKMFSSAPTGFNNPVNSCVSYFDASIPGTLPVLNRRCVEAGVKTGLALGSSLNHVSHFDRKHYFYADLPAGYQITQQRQPLAVGGSLSFPVSGLRESLGQSCYTASTDIVQLQLEQDSGKSLHDTERGRSLIDLNRAGTGLMEIVFGPDLRHGEEAAALVKELVLVLTRLNTCLARMDRGELRVDANISVRRPGGELGVRTEVKNLNSVRAVARAVEYEVERQVGVLEGGGIIENETRSWDFDTKKTLAMRDKEAKQDYRFLPEPNLPPLRLCDSAVKPATNLNMIDIAPIRSSIPELPGETRDKLSSSLGLSTEVSAQLVAWPSLLAFFRDCVELEPVSIKEVADLILLNNLTGEEIAISPSQLVGVSNMKQRKEISHGGLTEVLELVLRGDEREAEEIVREKELYLVRDRQVIEQFARSLLENNEKMVAKYKKAKDAKKQQKAFKSLLAIANKDPLVGKLDMVLFTQIFKSLLDS